MDKELKEEIKRQIAEALVDGVKEIVIREGKALEEKEPVTVKITGTIDAPLRWLKKRVAMGCIHQDNSHILVDREQMTITFRSEEDYYYGTQITGRLELSPVFKKFGINFGKYMTNFEMAELFKMNRSYFENRAVAMNLVTQLQNFKAKVDKDIENMDNKRGDRRILVNQVVQSIQLTSTRLQGTGEADYRRRGLCRAAKLQLLPDVARGQRPHPRLDG